MASDYEQRREYFQAYREAHRQEQREYAKEWHRVNKERRRAYQLARRYDITVEEWTSLYDKQKGLCAICGKVLEDNNIIVDHSHTTGETRGLLCHKCNRGLGHFDDSPEMLLRAYQYLTG